MSIFGIKQLISEYFAPKMASVPKDLTLNIPENEPKVVAGSSSDLLNWRNWLATILAIFIIYLAYEFSFLPLDQRFKMYEYLTGTEVDHMLKALLKDMEREGKLK